MLVPAINSDYDPELFASLEPKLELLAEDLVWWASTLREGRARKQVGASA